MWRKLLLVAVISGGLFFLINKVLNSSDSNEIIVSPNDDNQYRYHELDNGLKVLLISDPDTERSAAALDVNVGNGSDPIDRQGLAHFLEHMLFLGTEKYPTAGEYQEFIAEHGGNHNAYTSYEHTNYFFDIQSDFFVEALDRFAQFFVAPTFDDVYVDRERHAVDSEYKSKIKDDARRELEVLRTLMNPEHSMAKFSVGNLETLDNTDQESLRNDLFAFYEKYYSSAKMALVILGRETLDELQTLVEEKFSDIPLGSDSALEEESGEQKPLFLNGSLPAKVSIVPVKEKRSLTLMFPIPEIQSHYLKKPLGYIGHIIGYEGPGSLLSVLKNKGWAEWLSSGAGYSYQDSAAFVVKIGLTEAGLQQADKIVEFVFSNINLINEQDLQKSIYRETKTISELAFDFQEQGSPFNRVKSLASALHVYSPQYILKGGYSYLEFDEALISNYLSYLVPDNLLLTVVAPGLLTDAESYYYQTPYSVEVIDEKTLNSWQRPGVVSGLYLPEPNPFLPDDLALLELPADTAEKPQLLVDMKGKRLWYMQNSEFRLPKAYVTMDLFLPAAMGDANDAVMSEVYVGLVNEILVELSYPASLAGLNFNLIRHARGMRLYLGGYHQKQSILLEEILEVMANPQISEALFKRVKSRLLRSYKNADLQEPYKQAVAQIPSLLYWPHFSTEQLIDAIKPLNLSDITAYSKNIFADGSVKALIYGNYRKQEAIDLFDMLYSKLKLKDIVVQPSEVVDLRASAQSWLWSVDHQDQVLLRYYQGLDDSLESQANLMLIARLMEPKFYHQMRTEQQLGYIVFSGLYPLLRTAGIYTLVQSPSSNIEALGTKTESFITDFNEYLVSLPEEEFEKNRQSIVNELLEPVRNMPEKNGETWQAIRLNYFDFDYKENLLKALNQLTLDSVIRNYKELTDENSRKLLQIMVASPSELAQVDCEDDYVCVENEDKVEVEGKPYLLH